ncbi:MULTISPECIES: ABC transporter substrate-binding protein [unclassified Mesorhizobium]|uniref:ABC transporter substrate-binding protein n=1 Tax=unclassified Mesorhizobium TaxID=325217 RepID=UPI000FE41D73|nr:MULTISPECIES: ABC transporter substrate-binding protein [unclassified Mesorhizobium]RWQ13740.1 MAG: ABC transporter substrate-binding protein [Mesorhizobium sp.]TGQ37799.1 ABC transporter substrate-binding protein [Mesorhizobium sp. M4B.F.Ca.ET.214.01.1.1]TGQ59566.1 ABC transporter substrate-binding protein [Mesorhizobium sp. M4B.F.Ca.ET.211.01.1.1]TGU34632.1 ABC transporter substrate-binding protein [Mesorhizobium sp. M4B.F.Ca.ET.150.01.1.1]
MAISRRELIKAGLAAGAAASVPVLSRAQAAPAAAGTVRMVKDTDLQTFDPFLNWDYVTQDHGLAIYDTLFAPDSKMLPRPQMVGKWGVSQDKKIYTFELRDGLGWHDGTLVTAADCVASIRRWSQKSVGGQLMMQHVKNIYKKDEKTFVIELHESLGILIDILASPTYLYVMRERDAEIPATEQVTANIGSGPFKFNHSLAKPGASFTYDRNERYVPRKEPSDGLSGGKIVRVDQVIWENIRDPQTAAAALQAGEIDFMQLPPVELLSVIESDPDLALDVLDPSGQLMYLRMNCLQKPFNNVKARQALLHLVDQEAFLQVAIGDQKYYRTVTSFFGNGTLYTNDENTGWFKKGGDPEKAKRLFEESGYSGEPVVILQPTDWAQGSNVSELLAATLRNIGVNAELAASDWAGVAARREKKDSVENGGWSIFCTTESNSTRANPHVNVTMAANGDKAWYGWPKFEEYEALRAKWPNLETLEERQALARSMQKTYWDNVGTVLLGQFFQPIARRKSLTGLIGMPEVIPMWNMKRA